VFTWRVSQGERVHIDTPPCKMHTVYTYVVSMVWCVMQVRKVLQHLERPTGLLQHLAQDRAR
jgi:hypothetical protein